MYGSVAQFVLKAELGERCRLVAVRYTDKLLCWSSWTTGLIFGMRNSVFLDMLSYPQEEVSWGSFVLLLVDVALCRHYESSECILGTEMRILYCATLFFFFF